ncbi:MAG: endolytic transglycosylase MltG [Candidatus Accumulibacter sp.]|uniref:endolytic transglycosylase MltG n=1 Tax=Accumulibacter sp. TaxID=2053492 RepID=UPI002879C013|nr:endolytic transglycosylase MltG [Accumulibacter sp.]MDS4015881.1 endolytic transglycosylase MltG [Accumulibacter sp.]
MRRLVRQSLLLVLLLFALLAAGLLWRVFSPIPLAGGKIEFTIGAGSSMRLAAGEIAAAGADIEPWLLIGLARVLRVESSIKAGSYELAQGSTMLDLLGKLTRGDVTQAELLIIEGWTFRQLRARLDAHADLQHDTAGLPDSELLTRLGAREAAAEGLFFPDTYLFSKRSSDLDLLARAYRAMQAHLAREWQTRADGLPYRDAYQALIMASIIEKETGRADERSLIAGVFVNRLRQGMLLQTDPTVIYGLGEAFDGNLRKRDLLADTPYNTYTRRGLPPTPIALPGLASLRAALHPAASDALYFVARGDGSSHFSRTLDEHNEAVGRFQRRSKP